MKIKIFISIIGIFDFINLLVIMVPIAFTITVNNVNRIHRNKEEKQEYGNCKFFHQQSPFYDRIMRYSH